MTIGAVTVAHCTTNHSQAPGTGCESEQMDKITKDLKRYISQRFIGYQTNGGVQSSVYQCECEWTDGTKGRAYAIQEEAKMNGKGICEYEHARIAHFSQLPHIDPLEKSQIP